MDLDGPATAAAIEVAPILSFAIDVASAGATGATTGVAGGGGACNTLLMTTLSLWGDHDAVYPIISLTSSPTT